MCACGCVLKTHRLCKLCAGSWNAIHNAHKLSQVDASTSIRVNRLEPLAQALDNGTLAMTPCLCPDECSKLVTQDIHLKATRVCVCVASYDNSIATGG